MLIDAGPQAKLSELFGLDDRLAPGPRLDDALEAQSWFFGVNSRLGDHAPSAVLRQATDAEEVGLVVGAARALVDAELPIDASTPSR